MNQAVRSTRVKNVFSNIALFALSSAVSFLIAELVLRAFGYHGGVPFRIEDALTVNDPVLNWRHKPNSEYYFGDIVYRFNEKGFRDYAYPNDKPAHTFRIFLASDSLGFGTNVRLEESYPKLLEAQANALSLPFRTEVINYSMPGLSLKQKVHLVEQHAQSFHPDLIMIDYAINDIEFESRKKAGESSQGTCAIKLLHLPVPCSWKDRLKQSAFLFAIQQGIENALQRINVEDRNHFYDQVEGDYYHRLYAMREKREYLELWFRKIGEYQQETGIPVLVPIFPFIYDYDKYKWQDLNELIIHLCDANGLAYVPLLTSYKEYPWNELRVQRGDFSHPSVKGNTIAAKAILEAMQERGLLVQLPIHSDARGEGAASTGRDGHDDIPYAGQQGRGERRPYRP